ncbi:WecB/TagA/CpsF family glycosyltransferase [Sporolactobacillus sp. Y61]|uniref:WecB/TagA/CpsF family glycosyltransferase n=1 Tax=Sporolactobacillus sp. Y61 TaxID=3160863 RepID=A0AAU8IB89_9BACL
MDKKKKIGNIYMNVFSSKKEALAASLSFIARKSKLDLFFLNDYGFNIAQQDGAYRKILNQAGLLLNDGIGIKIGARIWGIQLQENLNGTDLIPLLLTHAAAENLSVYLLGSTEQNVRLAAEHLSQSIGGLKIAGCHHGYFQSDDEVVPAINQSGADILLVGMGMPLQEKFIARNHASLRPLTRIAAGGFIDFASGMKPRAPKWMRKLNLEWLYRMCLEPRRMWRRNVIGHAQFFFHVIRLKLKAGRDA